jgi:uncharacterized protein (DUF2147 family)
MTRLGLITVLLSVSVGTSALASDVIGVWRASEEGGKIAIERCGTSICGKILGGGAPQAGPSATDVKNKNPALRNRPLLGLTIMQGFSGGPQVWTGGTIYNPNDGGTYQATVKLAAADKLQVKGCIAPPLCKTQTWTRLK